MLILSICLSVHSMSLAVGAGLQVNSSAVRPQASARCFEDVLRELSKNRRLIRYGDHTVPILLAWENGK